MGHIGGVLFYLSYKISIEFILNYFSNGRYVQFQIYTFYQFLNNLSMIAQSMIETQISKFA